MTEAIKGKRRTQKQRAETKGIIGNFISIVEFAFIISFFIELAFNFYCWGTAGYQETINKLNQQYQQQTSGLFLRNSWFAVYYEALSQMVGKWTGEVWSDAEQDASNFSNIKEMKGIKNVSPQLRTDKNEQKLWKEIKKAKTIWSHFWGVFLGTLKVVLAKFVSVFASFWLYIFAALLGALDGAVCRYIRTAEGGRESTFVFHKVADTILKIPALILLIYLASPITLNPEIAVCLLALSFFLFFKIVTGNLKKFL